jgi:hypothetical protein
MRSILCLLTVAFTLCFIEDGLASISCYQCDSKYDDGCGAVVKDSTFIKKCPSDVDSCMIYKVFYNSAGMEIWRRGCANKKERVYKEKCYKKGGQGAGLIFCPCKKDLCNERF